MLDTRPTRQSDERYDWLYGETTRGRPERHNGQSRSQDFSTSLDIRTIGIQDVDCIERLVPTAVNENELLTYFLVDTFSALEEETQQHC